MNTIAIRGAITSDNNTIKSISEATIELYKSIISENKINQEEIIHITFSLTKDLNAVYPAKVLREEFNITDIPLICLQEADIINSLPKCIRILILVNSNLDKKNVKHIYLKDAKILRADLCK